MPGASSPHAVFIKPSDNQSAHERVNDNPAFNRARFWFWPIVISITLMFGFFMGIRGAFVGFFYGLVAGGLLLHESLPAKKK